MHSCVPAQCHARHAWRIVRVRAPVGSTRVDGVEMKHWALVFCGLWFFQKSRRWESSVICARFLTPTWHLLDRGGCGRNGRQRGLHGQRRRSRPRPRRGAIALLAHERIILNELVQHGGRAGGRQAPAGAARPGCAACVAHKNSRKERSRLVRTVPMGSAK